MTVWVVHPVRDDLSAAQHYGALKYITDGYVYPDQLDGEYIPDVVMGKLNAAANLSHGFKPKTDYLLIAGDHLQLVQFTAILSVLHARDGFNVLRYDRDAAGYLPVHIQPE